MSMRFQPHPLLEETDRALRRIDPVYTGSPLIPLPLPAIGSETLRIFCKIETLNPVRSFKGRGTSLLAANLPPSSTLVCASAGNFGFA
jgi:threonine dehydratase